MSDITQDEIREFWESCDLIPIKLDGEIIYYQDLEGLDILPEITLDNLFKYAVYGKLSRVYRNWKSLLHNWVVELTGDMEKDTASLFRILQEVMRNE